MWQSCVEIEDYSAVYFDRIAVFEALYRWTSVEGGAHTCFVDVWISNKSTKRVWAPPLMEVQRYGALNAAMQSKYATEQSLILHGTATRDGIILDFYMRVSHMHNNILGLLSCISVTHYPHNQGMQPVGFLESVLRCFFLNQFSFLQKTYLVAFLASLPQPLNQDGISRPDVQVWQSYTNCFQ